MTEQERLVDIIRGLVRAMRESVSNGCTDHLDCWDEAGELWYRPLERGEKAIAKHAGHDTAVQRPEGK